MNNLGYALAVALVVALSIINTEAQHCRPFGHFMGTSPPPGKCNSLVTECCVEGKVYHAYQCSPPLTTWEGETRAVLTLTKFEGSGPTDCDNLHHSDDEPLVALPTGWYNGGKRCGKEILIKTRDGKMSVKAKVVDECDSTWGCDELHAYQPPCSHNVIHASKAVWRELGMNTFEGESMELQVTWLEV